MTTGGVRKPTRRRRARPVPMRKVAAHLLDRAINLAGVELTVEFIGAHGR
jgi:hypothetical protein